MLLDHMIREEGGGVRNHPGPPNNTRHDVRWKLIMGRYGKPVLSPNYRTDIPDSGCSVRKESLDKFVTEAHTSRYGTRLNPVGTGRVRQPRPTPVRGVGVTGADPTRENRGSSLVADATTVTNTMDNTDPAGYHTPNDVPADGDWHKVMRKHRYVKSMGTQDYRTVVSEMDNFESYRTKQTVVADQCTSPVATTRPVGGSAEILARGGGGGYNRLKPWMDLTVA